MADDFLNMSDDDIRKMGVPDFSKMVNAKDAEPADAADEESAAEDTAAESADDEQSPLADPDTGADGEPEAAAEDGQAEGHSPDAPPSEGEQNEKASDVAQPAKSDAAVEEAANKEADKAEPAAAIDYKAEYEKLLAPFKANGRDMSVKSVEDAVTLMQMGANYNKKMAALKPNLKLMKMLENAGLLSEEQISYMIDLKAKNPQAINKLVKDSGIDPTELDAEQASAYIPTPRTVDEREMALDEVLDPIKDSPHIGKLLKVVSTEWDRASKDVVAEHPQILEVIHGHMDSGIYDLISAEVQSERLFGRLKGMSDLAAYKEIGDKMNARGAFNHLAQGSSRARTETVQPAVKVVSPKPVKTEADSLKDKRRAASSTKAAAPAAPAKDFDPLSMSDEEFSKHVQQKFL